MTEIKVDNDYLIIDAIYTEPKTALNVINPATGRPMGSTATFHDHPFRGLVVAASPYFYNGGIQYKSDIKAGDIVLLKEGVSKGTDYVYIDGIEYAVVRHGEVMAHGTPGITEREALTFVRNTKSQRKAREKDTLKN